MLASGILPIGDYSGQFAGFHFIVDLPCPGGTDQDNGVLSAAFPAD
jgi:hypothetical protein